MESNNAEAEMRTRVSTPVSRWSPTKEQISILENLYKQGIRTPTADQIQRITCTLRAYGHIEGKNVFYWFQNHKARLRQKQKQKQQTVAYFNPFLHTSHPISSNSLCQKSVFCAPHCLEQSGIRFYPQQAKVIAAEGMPKMCDGPQQLQERETLPLFPLHPTGILEGKTSSLHTTSDARK